MRPPHAHRPAGSGPKRRSCPSQGQPGASVLIAWAPSSGHPSPITPTPLGKAATSPAPATRPPPPTQARPTCIRLMSTNPFARGGGSLLAQLGAAQPQAAGGAQHTPASPTPNTPPAPSTSTPPRAGQGGSGKGKSPMGRSLLGNQLVTPPRVASSSPFGSPSSSPQHNQQSPINSPSQVQSSPGSSSGGSPQSTSGTGGGISRRVKLYKLSDEHWQDLGTGSCATHYNNNSNNKLPTNSPGNRLATKSTDPSSPPEFTEDGAWIVVTREAEQPHEGETEPPPPPPPPPATGEPGEIILRSKVFPYPAGYDSSEEDEEEAGFDKEGRPLDPGGYHRQQDTLIVWTEKDTDEEMALSFATASGCSEVWNFIRNARKMMGSEYSTVQPRRVELVGWWAD